MFLSSAYTASSITVFVVDSLDERRFTTVAEILDATYDPLYLLDYCITEIALSLLQGNYETIAEDAILIELNFPFELSELLEKEINYDALRSRNRAAL